MGRTLGTLISQWLHALGDLDKAHHSSASVSPSVKLGRGVGAQRFFPPRMYLSWKPEALVVSPGHTA